jgi:citrate synthase
MEQYANNRIYRPRALYAGPTGLSWVPITDRKPA